DLAKLGAKDLQEKLPVRTAFVDLIQYAYNVKGQHEGQRYVAFVLAPGKELQRIDIGSANEIGEAARPCRKDIDDGVPSKHAGSLSELVWKKILPHIPSDTTTIYLPADGELMRIPFAAFPGKKQDTILLEDYRIAHVPYGGYLLEQFLYP